MSELARPVGLALTARGEPVDLFRWAGEAARGAVNPHTRVICPTAGSAPDGRAAR